jgi:FAD/FMN-containing dehydrogenase
VDPDVLAKLRAIVGERHVLVDPDLTAGYSVDWTGRFRGSASAVVRPASTAEVAAIVRICAAGRSPLVVQGGNTGLVGGSVPMAGEIVVHLGRLDHLEPVDTVAAQVTVGAGVRLALLHEHARLAGLAFGVDLGARDSCTIGGMIATNAGGINVVRHGMMRQQVMGIEAVLGDGSVVSHLSGLPKDNTGYDLAGLLTGSEGTLGVITRARLRLVPRYDERVTAVLGFADVKAAVGASGHLRRRLADLDALELMLAPGIALVLGTDYASAPDALRAPAVLLVEVAAHLDPTDAFASVVERLDLAAVPLVAIGSEQRARLWAIREGHTEAIGRLGPPIKLDVSVPIAEIARFVAALPAVVPDGAGLVVFGHLGDGNLHVNVTGVLRSVANEGGGPPPVLPPDATVESIEHDVLTLVVAHGGSISAEHGIGIAKVRHLTMCRSAEEIAAFRAIKRALDPHLILNPSVLVAGT